MFYIVSFLAIALFPFALAAYGGHLAAKVLDEKDRWTAFLIVWTLASLGVIMAGLQQYMVYRSDQANEVRQGKSENEAKDLNNEVHNLKTDTSNLISAISGTLPMIAALNSDLATLRRDTEAAKEHHDPRMVANLEHQAQTAQQQVDALSHELLAITMAPQIAEQLREWHGTYRQKIKDMHSQQDEENIRWDAKHPNDPEGRTKAWNDWNAQIDRAEQDSEEQWNKTVANADFIRKELLQRIPLQLQSVEDKRQEKEFVKTRDDPQSADKAAHYLEELARRVPPPK